MLNYSSPIIDKKEYADLIILKIDPIIKINLRGKTRDFLTKIGKSLSIIPPSEANTSSGNDNLNIIWLSPDEWMIYSNNKINSGNYVLKNKYNFSLQKIVSKINYNSRKKIKIKWVSSKIIKEKFYKYKKLPYWRPQFSNIDDLANFIIKST